MTGKLKKLMEKNDVKSLKKPDPVTDLTAKIDVMGRQTDDNMTDLQLALAEVYEMLVGGV